MHDHWQCYWPMAGVEHAPTHHQPAGVAGAGGVRQGGLARGACSASASGPACGADRAGAGTHAVPGRPETNRVWRAYDRLLVEALAFHESQPPLPSPGRRGTPRRRKGHNLALRLHERRRDPALPHRPTGPLHQSSEAERDLRMMKLRQKISGGFRSRSGADDFAILRTIIATAQKQADILNTLKTISDSSSTNIQYA